MQADNHFANLYKKALAETDKQKQRLILGQLAVELIDASLKRQIDWRLVNSYAYKFQPLMDKNDLMMRDLVCDMEHWDDYTRDHGEFERIRQFALDISKGVFYEELTTAMIYYVKRQGGRTLSGVSYVAWEDNGRMRSHMGNSQSTTLDPILSRSKNINDFVNNLPAKIGELELFDKPEITAQFRFDIGS